MGHFSPPDAPKMARSGPPDIPDLPPFRGNTPFSGFSPGIYLVISGQKQPFFGARNLPLRGRCFRDRPVHRMTMVCTQKHPFLTTPFWPGFLCVVGVLAKKGGPKVVITCRKSTKNRPKMALFGGFRGPPGIGPFRGYPGFARDRSRLGHFGVDIQVVPTPQDLLHRAHVGIPYCEGPYRVVSCTCILYICRS